MSADPRQRLVVAHSVDPAAEHEAQGNLPLALAGGSPGGWSSAAATNPELYQRGPSTWSRPAPWSEETAVRLGVNSDEDLLGGFVEHAFIAGKAIVHPLPRGGVAPEGWNPLFAEKVRDVVLNGVSVSAWPTYTAQAPACSPKDRCGPAGGGLWRPRPVRGTTSTNWTLGSAGWRSASWRRAWYWKPTWRVVTHSVGQLRVNGFC